MRDSANESSAIPALDLRLSQSVLTWLARRALTGQLRRLDDGEISMTDGAWSARVGRSRSVPPLRARITVHDRRAYRRLLAAGTMGAAEAYANGEWSVDDLTALVRIFARNRAMASGLDGRLGRWAHPLHRLAHRLRSNTVEGSRSNIAAHYDLGNDFFRTFLDDTMSYSCAIYPRPDAPLEEASRFKIDLLCRKLNLREHDELLEIGTGWGAFAIHAASAFGCRVVTTTISREQYTMAVERVRQAGLDHRITVLNLDYRMLPSLGRTFDKLVSVEMIEAVGERFLPEFFSVCQRLLKPTGVMVLQSIVIADELFERYRSSVDFIQRYIFPGGFLPSRALLRLLVERTDARLVHIEDFTPHYARTLVDWRRAFLSARPELHSLGYPDRLLRLWDYYFCYCEGGFLEQTIGLVQAVFAMPKAAPALASSGELAC